MVVSGVVGGGGTAYALWVSRPRDETTAGLRTLATMSWREFTRLMLDVMAHRGFLRTENDTAADDGRHTLVRGSERLSLWCKHGSAFLIGKLTVNELANDMRLAGTRAGVLATQGRIVEDARDAASDQGIELLDGSALWTEARTRLPESTLASIRKTAARRACRRIVAAWLMAALAGIGSHGVLTRLMPPTGTATTPDIATGSAGASVQEPVAPEETLPVRSPPAADGEPVAAAAVADPPPPATTSSLSPADQRHAAVRDVVDLPMVARAEWTSASTLQVELRSTDADAFEHICPLVERHPDIATSRIQLNLPAGSDVPVRFRQCRTF